MRPVRRLELTAGCQIDRGHPGHEPHLQRLPMHEWTSPYSDSSIRATSKVIAETLSILGFIVSAVRRLGLCFVRFVRGIDWKGKGGGLWFTSLLKPCIGVKNTSCVMPARGSCSPANEYELFLKEP